MLYKQLNKFEISKQLPVLFDVEIKLKFQLFRNEADIAYQVLIKN